MLLKNIFLKINIFLSNGHVRSVRAKKNIAKLALIRGLGVGLSLLMVPLTINYVSPTEYGIWMAVSSIVAWVSLFDLGLSNGLRNRLSEAFSRSDFELSQRLISTAYAILFLIFLPLFIIISVSAYFIDWSGLLNLPAESARSLHFVVAVLAAYFCLKFTLSTANVVLLATQNAARATYSGLFEQILLLIVVFILTKTTKGSLAILATAMLISSSLVLILCNLSVFRWELKKISPRLSKVDFRLSGNIFSLGVKFFVIQIAGIVQFQTANLLLIRYYGPAEVTNYNIAIKYFSLLPMAMAIALTPMWSAVSDAHSQNDRDWIVNAVRKYNKLGAIICLAGVVMLVLSGISFKFWIRNEQVQIPFTLSFWVFVFSALNVYGATYSCALNGAGALNVQFVACLFSPFIFLLACYVLIGIFKFGVSAIVISSIIANVNGYILAPIQFKRIFESYKS